MHPRWRSTAGQLAAGGGAGHVAAHARHLGGRGERMFVSEALLLAGPLAGWVAGQRVVAVLLRRLLPFTRRTATAAAASPVALSHNTTHCSTLRPRAPPCLPGVCAGAPAPLLPALHLQVRNPSRRRLAGTGGGREPHGGAGEVSVMGTDPLVLHGCLLSVPRGRCLQALPAPAPLPAWPLPPIC